MVPGRGPLATGCDRTQSVDSFTYSSMLNPPIASIIGILLPSLERAAIRKVGVTLSTLTAEILTSEQNRLHRASEPVRKRTRAHIGWRSRASWPGSTTTLAALSEIAKLGASRTISSEVRRGSVQSVPLHCLPACLNWVTYIVTSSLPWRVWNVSTATAPPPG